MQTQDKKETCTYVNKRTAWHNVWFLYICVPLWVKEQSSRVLCCSCPVLALTLLSIHQCHIHGSVWCAWKQNQKVTMRFKAVSHYNTCSHVKHTHTETQKRDFWYPPPSYLSTYRILKAVHFHTDGILDVLLLLYLSRNACWYFSDV